MMFFLLFYEFFMVGLLAVGGGLATFPFLIDLGERTGWFTAMELADMLAISESTPGPIGVKMAAYVGFLYTGAAGAVVATLGLAAPSILINLLIARFLNQFRENRLVDGVFQSLRPASAALIATALIPLARLSLTADSWLAPVWPAIGISGLVFLLLWWRPTRGWHPLIFLAFSAIAGIILRL